MSINTAIATSHKKIALFDQWYAREQVLARFSLGVLALIPLLLAAVLIDERTQNGVNIWIKPIKFNIAISLYLGTLVWFSGWIDQAFKRTVSYRIYTWILCGSLVVLFAWLYSAALIGEPAHYNRSHSILTPLYRLMATTAETSEPPTNSHCGFSNQ